ncbi:hypothetical protein [Thalassobacillus sp. C254]|uniref:hypothetical protein n=1 Tax=Thalassobacillus sp. C254 TaxID=1225341 RepID=UPI0006D1A9DF|nr:hypothetical protein [Thalassobacillus sp. C254]
MKEQPLFWALLMMMSFGFLFFIGAYQFTETAQIILQSVGFGGFVFSMLYGVLITQHLEQKKASEQEEHYIKSPLK